MLWYLKLNQLEFCAEASVGAVEERAKLAAVNIVLHVARVPVIGNIEDGQSDSPFVPLAAEGNGHAFRNQDVECH